MEFSRWGLRKISRISDRYRDFTSFLTDVLEGERSLLGAGATAHGSGEIAESAFHVRDEFVMPTVTHRGALSAARVHLVFRALAPCFEAGFLLRPVGRDVALDTMFLFGRVFEAGDSEAPKAQLAFPDLTGGRVIRGRVAPVLRAFRLDGCETLRASSVFAFAPTRGWFFVLICNRPHPWQVGMVERAAQAVTDTLQDRRPS